VPSTSLSSSPTARSSTRTAGYCVRHSGEEVDVTDSSAKCSSDETIPTGLWYVSRDADGKLQIVAPSVTELPNAFPQQVALRACGEEADEGVTLFVPDVAMNWIRTNVGAVLIDD
jgi:hypothetical protein